MKEHPNKFPPNTQLGYVHLAVSDLERSISFYQRALGFQVHEKKEASASLGAGGDDLLVLTEEPGAVSVPKRTVVYTTLQSWCPLDWRWRSRLRI
jgi:catechol-2,3-dioxygenase